MKPFLLATLLLVSVSASALPITVFNTGVDASGDSLPGGAIDPHWSVVGEGPARVVSSPLPDVWLPNTSVSQWISQNADGTPTNTTRVFRTTFDLTGLDPATAMLLGRWASDDFGTDITINGLSIVPPNLPSIGFWQWTDFAIPNAALNSGLNTLEFTVQDVGGVLGFRAEFLTATAERVPETGGTMTLLLGGLAAVYAANASRRRSDRVAIPASGA